ncbi:MAG: UDP-glucose 4-epimerase GalE [Vicinamibacterales bacterium]
MAQVLVTGGAGYIGSHAVKALVNAGHRVVVIDNLSAGHRRAVPDSVPFVEAAIHDGAAVRSIIGEHGVQVVMHFAAWLDVGESVRRPAAYYHNNVVGTLALLEAMVDQGVTALVFSSTCAVYGEPTTVPIPESHEERPLSPYGETKLAVERALAHFGRAYGLRSVILRYFNAAGADPEGTIGEDHSPEIHLIPRAIEAAKGGPALQLFGEDYPTPDGTCIRDYVHVADLADAHVRAVDALTAGGESATYNVGTGRGWSVREVIDTVSRVVGQPVSWQSAPRRAGDPAALYAASGRLQGELGWSPKYPELETIVRHAHQWHQSHPRGFDSP